MRGSRVPVRVLAAAFAAVVVTVMFVAPAGAGKPTPVTSMRSHQAHQGGAGVSLAAMVLYDQIDNVGSNGAPSQNFGDAYDSQMADDFVVPGGQTWLVDQVDVLGGYSTSGPVPSVDVVFYADAGTVPGAPLYTYPGVVPSADVAGDLTIPLAPPAMLVPGSYWVSVVANMDFYVGGQWFWNTRSVQSYDPYAWQNPGGDFGTGCTTWAAGASVCGVGGGVEPDALFRLRGSYGGCAISGTPDDDILTGTPGDDEMCGLGGRDTMSGLGGDDTMSGGAGRDSLKGGGGADDLTGDAGPDVLKGGGGPDTIHADDGVGNDLLNGGPGHDVCYVDPSDTVSNCEEVYSEEV